MIILLKSIILVCFLFLTSIYGDKYWYTFFKLGRIDGYNVQNGTIVVTTEGYSYNTYPKPQSSSNFDSATFEIFDQNLRTYEYLFDQFLIGSNEYLKFINPKDGDYYKYGNDIIHRGNHAYYQITTTNSTVVFSYDKTLNNDTFKHTGIKFFVRERNPNKYWCSNFNNNHDIFIDIEPYFLLSYSYPYTTPTNNSCTFNVNSNSEYLRVFIYDFRLNSNVNEYIKISGQLIDSINDDDVDPNYLTGYLTSDLPVTFYYKGNITIYVNKLFGQNSSKFFIKITPYNSTSFNDPNDNYCLGMDTFTLSQDNPIKFGIKSYENGDFYKPNSKCLWKFNDLLGENLRFLFNLDLESEYGCDHLEMSGFGKNSKDIWRYQGYQSKKFVYATSTSNVSLKWKADDVQNAIGFMGTVRIQDCSCLNLPTTVNYNSPIYIYNPGFKDNDVPYCPNVICNWNFKYDITKEYLSIKNVVFNLRNPSYFGKISNTLSIENQFNRTLFTLTANNILSNGKTFYSSSGNTNIQWVSDTGNVFNINNIERGFYFIIKTKLFPNIIKQKVVDLSKSNRSVFISGSDQSIIIKIIGSKGFIKIIPQQYFMSSNVLVDVFKDDISLNNLINDSYFFSRDAYSPQPNGLYINSKVVYIRICKATYDYNDDKVNYNFFVSDLNLNDKGTNNSTYQNIPSNQTSIINVTSTMYLNVVNDNTSVSNGLLISTNGSELSIFNGANILVSQLGIYPLYFYGNSISFSIKNNSQEVSLTPTILPPVLIYKIYNDFNGKNFIYSKDYYSSSPEKTTKMKFVFYDGPRYFNLVLMELRGPGKIEILIKNIGEIIDNKTISKTNDEHYLLCGTEIELNYDSNISNFSVLPNEISGFIGVYQISTSCRPSKKNSSYLLRDNKQLTIFLLVSWILNFIFKQI
uniref:CUB domain-containing protein n=1 Tax=Strongyloides stercoralis TaxID=6248 RepID=A0A0K0EM38_STRER